VSATVRGEPATSLAQRGPQRLGINAVRRHHRSGERINQNGSEGEFFNAPGHRRILLVVWGYSPPAAVLATGAGSKKDGTNRSGNSGRYAAGGAPKACGIGSVAMTRKARSGTATSRITEFTIG
jgi:hypothetical protein